eukprot:TRINITY_DN16604_c0_g2_i2.p1 TRINITY_DN16604_c0_g2~~TRINITY_DN16604_c0_g2_i2.p1  ORF type:complete len:611 (+),score=158.63 TRINITY_DN16604_c0_g2_i2:73-1905(+)
MCIRDRYRTFQKEKEMPKENNNVTIVVLIFLLALSLIIIIRLLYRSNEISKETDSKVSVTENIPVEKSIKEPNVENSRRSEVKEYSSANKENKQLMLYEEACKASLKIMQMSLNSNKEMGKSQMIETSEYSLEKQPGVGIVKTIKQEVREYYPDQEEPKLLEEAKNISMKMGVDLDSKKVSLKNTKIAFGMNVKRSTDLTDSEIKSVYTITTDKESERSLENGRFAKSFDSIELLGVGGFAEVFRARHVLDEKYYAVKRIVVQHNTKKSVKGRKAYREIRALKAFDHHNIVRYITCWTETPTVEQLQHCKTHASEEVEESSKKTEEVVVSNAPATSGLGFEWDRGSRDQDSIQANSSIPAANNHSKFNNTPLNESNYRNELSPINPKHNQAIKMIEEREISLLDNTVDLAYYIQMILYPSTLREYLKKRAESVESRRNLKYFGQIVNALVEIHSKKLIHRDMKPANIFLDANDDVKVGDFGLTVRMGEEDSFESAESSEGTAHTEGAGTKQYLSPEQESGRYGQKVDVYAAGLILMELSCLFATEHERLLAFEKVRKRRCLPEGFDCMKYKEEGELIIKMTERAPENRPTAKEVLELEAYKRWLKREEKD